MKDEVLIDSRPSWGGRRARRDSFVAPLTASLVLYGLFIARSSFKLRGARAFSLFDDSMVSMVYARNLARGNGLVWNSGSTSVEGITNPLWTGVMAVVHLLPLEDRHYALVVMVLGAGLLVASALLARSLVEAIAPQARYAPTLALWLVALYYPLVFWTLRGMEVGLVTVLALAGAVLSLRIANGTRRASADVWLLAAVVAAGLTTRIDFAVFAVVYAYYLAARRSCRRAAGVLIGAATLTVLSQEVARHAYYGAWLPNTYVLKMEGFGLATRLPRGLAGLGFTAVSELGALLVLGVAALAVPLTRRNGGTLLAAGFAAASMYSVYVGGDAWEWTRYPNRYITPGVVFLIVLASLGVERLISIRSTAEGRRVWAVVAAATAATGALAGWNPFPVHLLQHARFPGAGIGYNAWIGLCFVAVALTWVRLRDGRDGGRTSATLVAALCGAAIFVSVSAPAWTAWATGNGVHVDDDANWARLGLLLEEVTNEDARVAVTSAGAPIYFAHRRGVDILGKSDARIAHLAPRPGTFHPGHNKWSYEISIFGDRPDVVAQLWTWRPGEVDAMLAAGYARVRPTRDVARALGFGVEDTPVLLVREDSTAVDMTELVRLDADASP